MANQADFLIKNVCFAEGLEVSKLTPVATIADGIEERIPVLSPDESLVIKAPVGKDIRYCPLTVKSDVDLSVTVSRTNSTWTLKIIPNDLPPDVPTTVNVTIEDGQP
jgi:hypothetical protein